MMSIVAAGRPWVVAPAAPPALFAALPDLHPICVQVLYNRGLTSAADVSLFLGGGRLYDPRALLGMDRAIERIGLAVRRGEKIAAHGDYDVDGVTATAVLTEGLRAAGANVVPFIPQRAVTGYGVHASTIDRLAAEGVGLVVTGDTGTRAFEAANRALEVGIDVIVTDHHLPGEDLPQVAALVNPHQDACAYPFKELSGCGVAWKLVQALAAEGLLGRFRAEDLLDLVALGTIVDVSPLVGENRLLVQRGLRRLSEATRPGLRALLAGGNGTAGTMQVDERTVGFFIGPRLNAAGRMDSADVALELLLTHDPVRASELVLQLEAQNAERQRLTEQVLVEARQQAAQLAGQPVLVLRGRRWPSGVIGLVASRLAEEYRRPAFVVDVGTDTSRGSGRTAQGFDLVAALTGCADLLIEFGGHAQAAGFAVATGQLEALVERLIGAAGAHLPPDDEPVVADVALEESQLEWRIYHALAALRPFGAGNARPLFLTRGLRLLEARGVGAGGKHLRVRLRAGRQVLTAFGPDLGGLASGLAGAGAVDALYSLESSTWNGIESLELRLRDVRPAASSWGPA